MTIAKPLNPRPSELPKLIESFCTFRGGSGRIRVIIYIYGLASPPRFQLPSHGDYLLSTPTVLPSSSPTTRIPSFTGREVVRCKQTILVQFVLDYTSPAGEFLLSFHPYGFFLLMMDSTDDCSSTLDSVEQLPCLNLPLPSAFLEFLHKNCIDPSVYDLHDSIPRYIRIKRGNESYLPEIEAELKCNLQDVSWLPGFFAIPPHIQIASLSVYRQGKIYGMDAASGAAVLALNVLPGDHVLDLCAAPGAKLCMLSDMLGDTGSLTGVDVSRQRLAACRTMLQKYVLGDHCRLFVADGTSFSLLPLRTNLNPRSCSGSEKSEYSQDVFKEWSSRRRWIERKNAKKTSIISGTSELELIFYGRRSGVIGLSKCEIFDKRYDYENSDFGYDKVLVDAECTHDGSIKHIQKFEHWGWETLQRRLLDAQRMDNLMHLQLQLLTNGFKLLKAGGTLVYSTCSLTIAQNESILEQFLSKNKHAELLEIDHAKDWPCKNGRIPKTLRFDPCTSKTSGLFVAKLVKRAN